MSARTIRQWFAVRFLPLSVLDYAAVVAAVIGLIREIQRWLAA